MMKCVKCGAVDAVMRAGFLRGKQRFFCKTCEYHFTIPRPEAEVERKRTQTTIIDVARAVGVAPSTVSRALNGHTDISAATRQVILEAARQLDYQPSLLAQSLQSRETYTIGVIIPDIERPFFATAVSGIQQVAAEAGYRVMICQSNESYETEVSNVQALIASRVDGLLISHTRETENFDHVLPPARKGIPIVQFDRVSNEVHSAQVVIDDWGGAFAVTEHLIRQGCERIAMLAGPSALLISQHRIQGYRDALQHYGHSFNEDWVVHGDFRPESALAALDAWLALPEPPDALFAMRYTDAFNLMTGLKARGLRIPGDVAVVGFGDEYLAAMVEPGLTTINLHPYRIGQQAARLFLEQVRQKESFQPRTFVIAGDLVIRQSSLRSGAPEALAVVGG